MNLDEIMEMWSEDTQIDKTKISEEAVKTVSLHSKYYNILVKERLRHKKMEQERNKLLNLKFEYYMGELCADDLKKLNWPQFQKKLTKEGIERVMLADSDIIDTNLKIGIQKEKVDYLAEIIKSVNARNFSIKSIIDWERFKAGEF